MERRLGFVSASLRWLLDAVSVLVGERARSLCSSLWSLDLKDRLVLVVVWVRDVKVHLEEVWGFRIQFE